MTNLMTNMTPDTPLGADEVVVQSFHADRATYVRSNTWLAAGAMAVGMAILWAMGNPHVWTGAVGGLAAVAVRAFYLMSEALATRWDLTNRRVLGPMGRAIPLSTIKDLNTLGSMVQIVTHTGDKHLIKFQPVPKTTISAIRAAAATGGSA